MSDIKYTFTEGAMWEGIPWSININELCNGTLSKPCKHCHSYKEVVHTGYNGCIYTNPEWICPKVIEVYNEGGHCSTGLCLDCLLEAVGKL
jgi:hypothetical protein